eukprot:GHVS01041520.1.p1 GENE.GHVS01041520.1~~GHVS01041520.1.p1  ORF type:complete len:494 (-),score=79.01 GHVS01041520.1:409-1890(-)
MKRGNEKWWGRGFLCKYREKVVVQVSSVGDSRVFMNSRGDLVDRKSEMVVRTYRVAEQQPLHQLAQQQRHRLEAMSTEMARRYSEEWESAQLATAHVGDITEQRCVVVCGLVTCEAEGELTEASVLLQGLSSSHSRECQLWLNKVPKWCAYPGQVVAVVGECEEGTNLPRLLASEFVSGVPVAPPTISMSELASTQDQYNGEAVHVCVAVGPFHGRAAADQPLEFLLKRFRIDQPHVVILLGPFVDSSSLAGNMRSEQSSVDELYKSMFSKIGDFGRARVGKTKVIVLPSLTDCLHPYPLPQPPLLCSLEKLVGLVEDDEEPSNYKYIEFLSNPGYVKLNELTICITSADVLQPIVSRAVCHGPGALRKVEKVIEDMQKQHSLFPSLLSSYSVDPPLAHLLHFPVDVLPHVSIFSSTASAQPLVQPSGGRLFVNCAPSMYKGVELDATGGYVNIFIAPPQSLENVEAQADIPLNLPERVAMEFVRPTSTQLQQ